MNQAVILAGGRGERLKPLTDHLPKPVAPINGIPFLDYLLESVVRVGIGRVLLLLGYRSDVIIDRYSRLSHPRLDIQYSVGSVEDQTGRRLLNAYGLLDSNFLLLYGDNYWPIELDRMKAHYQRKQALVSTTVFKNSQGTGEYGKDNNIEVGEDSLVRGYDKTRRAARLNGVDIGYFLVNKKVFDDGYEGNISFEQNVLPQLITKHQLMAYVTDAQYYWITDRDSLKTFERVALRDQIKPIAWTD